MAGSNTSNAPRSKPKSAVQVRGSTSRQSSATAKKSAEISPEASATFPQIVSGFVELFRHVDPDDFMWTGSGAREIKTHITYDRYWSATPFVIVNLVALDASKSHNLRYEVFVDSATVLGFEIVFRTWSDTMIASASVQWTAIGLSAEDRLRSMLSK